MTYGLAGKHDRAQKILDRLKQADGSRRAPSIFPAFVYVGMGDYCSALNHIEKAFDEHDAFVLWLRVSPDWDLIRGELRFQEILTRLGLSGRDTG